VNILKICLLVITLVLALFLGIYSTSASVKTVKIEEKTLESEVNRLSVKYEVSSSTVKKIIGCESKMYKEAVNNNYSYKTVTNKDGSTTTVKYVWSKDWGPLQINDFWHEAVMKKMGLDIHDEWDSLEYGFYLIKKEGLKPWNASAYCWKEKIPSVSTSTAHV